MIPLEASTGPSFEEPIPALTKEVFDRLLIWASAQDASDVTLSPNDPIWMRQHGVWWPVTRAVTGGEIATLVNILANQSNAAALAQSGQDQDFSYEVQVRRGERLRFRCNATGCRDGWLAGVSVVLRTIPGVPPALDALDVEPEIIESVMPHYGLVLVTGPVGSGKSTLLGAVLRRIVETQRRHVLTYEAPVEFDLVGVPGRIAPIVQTEIPKHLHSFEAAPRNSLRRAGDVVLFGESRDRETIRNMSIEAETGVAVYSTVHTNSVPETLSRMVREFAWEERDGMAATLIASLRLIVHQRLVRNIDGSGRVALREFLVVDEAVRRALTGVRVDSLIECMEEQVIERGQSLAADARRKFEAGLIGERECAMFTSTG